MAVIAPRRDPRVVTYAVVGVGCLVLGLLTGEPEPVAAAAAIFAVVVVGLRRIEPMTVEPTIAVSAGRVIEGDPISVAVTVRHPPSHRVELLVVDRSDALGPADYVGLDRQPGITGVDLAFATPEWGRHDLGRLVVRARVPGAMCTWELPVAGLGTVTVLPRPAHLTALLSPRATQVSSGGHPAKLFAGDGSEFVDIRAYASGDRLRDVNWKATARRGTPQVNRRRPERGGDVVIVLDATADGWRQSDLGSALLQRAGEAVWGLARHHIAAQDRVGLLTQQSDGVDWLPPMGGVRARYRVLDALLGANASGRPASRRPAIHRHDVPSSALVIGVSTLANNVTLRSLAAMRAHGRVVGVLAIDAAQLLHESDALDAASRRLATMLFDAHVAFVRRLGLPIVTWRPGEDLDRAVTRLAELTRRSVRVRSSA